MVSFQYFWIFPMNRGPQANLDGIEDFKIYYNELVVLDVS